MKAQSALVLQVHDEVILELHPDEIPEIRELTVTKMSEAAELRVPLEVHVALGPTWAEAKN